MTSVKHELGDTHEWSYFSWTPEQEAALIEDRTTVIVWLNNGDDKCARRCIYRGIWKKDPDADLGPSYQFEDLSDPEHEPGYWCVSLNICDPDSLETLP